MQPAGLTAAAFARYPPAGRAVAVAHLLLLQQLPLAFLPSLLREVVDYDYKFPVERTQLDRQLAWLAAQSAAQLAEVFAAFAAVRVPPEQAAQDWAGRPMDFTEDLSAMLWSTHQMSAFRDAATAYGDRMHAALPPPALVIRRLGIAIIGQGATPQADTSLFHHLRKHGTMFTNIDPTDGVAQLLAATEARARSHPAPYAHWYIDGGQPAPNAGALTTVSYGELAPVRAALLDNIQHEVGKAGMGPEALRDHLTHLDPAALGMHGDPVLDRFQLKVLTEGSGTQIFSTTFAQWTTREVLRRAEAATVVVRFAPRQLQRPMNELLTNAAAAPQLDAEGSLVDADMASYYHWINQQRLPGAAQSAFLAWFEGQRQALAIGPALPRNTGSATPLTLQQLVALVEG